MPRPEGDLDSYYLPGTGQPRPVAGIEEVVFYGLKHTDTWDKIQACRYIITALVHAGWLAADQPRSGCGDDGCGVCMKMKAEMEN